MSSVDPMLVEAFNDAANAAAIAVGDAIMTFAEQRAGTDATLPVGSTYFAAVCGAATGALKVLQAAAESGLLPNSDEGFHRLMAQMTDIWGQIGGEAVTGSTVQ